jgi:UDP-4-amino-4,6-dideoxy-N-acetyl-beta-L-altrosamine transaminase
MNHKQRAFLNYGKQWIDQDDINAVISVLKSDYLTQGPAIEKFEREICDITGAKYCVAVANGTAALHLAVKVLDIEKGKEGITSPITFVASSNAMIYNNLKPNFADIDEKTYCVDPEKIKEKITENTRLIIPVHFAGQPCDMQRIYKIANYEPRAKSRQLFIIEDAAHAIGSIYEDGTTVGNCKYSDMTIFSFHPVKTITSAEGGAITTNSKKLYEKLCLLRTHGITKDNLKFKIKNLNLTGPWYYEMQELGFNYRISDLHAALGFSQLKKLQKFKKRRREIVDKYNKAFEKLEWIKTLYERENLESCFHLYVIQIDFEKIGKTRKEVMEILRRKNIGTQVHYIPVHLQPYYKENFGYKDGDFPKAEKYYENCLSLPLYPKMTDEDVNYVVEEIRKMKVEMSNC